MSMPSEVGTTRYNSGATSEISKPNDVPAGIIVAEDVTCPYCGKRAPGGEGVHEHCERVKVIESNAKVIDTNQRAVDSNTALIAAMEKLAEGLNRIGSTQTTPNATITIRTEQANTPAPINVVTSPPELSETTPTPATNILPSPPDGSSPSVSSSGHVQWFKKPPSNPYMDRKRKRGR